MDAAVVMPFTTDAPLYRHRNFWHISQKDMQIRLLIYTYGCLCIMDVGMYLQVTSIVDPPHPPPSKRNQTVHDDDSLMMKWPPSLLAL